MESKLIKSLCSLSEMKKTLITQYHPMGIGMVEGFNRTLLNMLATQRESEIGLDVPCPTMGYAYNATVHDSTGFSPFF